MDLLSFKEAIIRKFEEIEKQLSEPDVTSNQEMLQRLGREHARMTELKNLYAEYDKAADDKEFLSDMKNEGEISEEEYETMKNETEEKISEIEFQLLKNLVPPDEYDNRNIIMEIRAGAGGDEAGLFGGDLMRMYIRYAERNRWKIDIVDLTESGIGSIKIAVLKIRGKDVYAKLKYESGVHRVQRVPATEASGRIHTSTATVAVFPEVTDIDVTIDPKDLRIDTFRAGGAGGQYVNKTESAVRVTHMPSGIVVSCQNERDQHQNKEACMVMLRTKLFEIKLQEQQSKLASDRKSQIGTGDRSEKIRTYNFPQSRVTDHRVGYTSYNIDGLMDGDIDELLEKLIEFDLNEKLENLEI